MFQGFGNFMNAALGPNIMQGQLGFTKQYRCRSVAFHKPEMESGGKIVLPASALDMLTRLNVTYPMLFELTNTVTEQRTHCGVLEFTASEGNCYVPYWMMEYLLMEEGQLLTVRNVQLPLATYVKLQPHRTAFIEVANPKAVLEMAFRNFSCLSKGDVICINYMDQKFYINVLEVKPDTYNAVSIVETDVKLDFEQPVDYVEPEKPAPATSEPAAKRYRVASADDNAAAVSSTASNSEKDATQLVFGGTGYRLNGKPAASSSSQTSASDNSKPKKTRMTLVGGVLKEVVVDDDSSEDDSDDDSEEVVVADSESDDDGDGFVAFSGSGAALRQKKKKK